MMLGYVNNTTTGVWTGVLQSVAGGLGTGCILALNPSGGNVGIGLFSPMPSTLTVNGGGNPNVIRLVYNAGYGISLYSDNGNFYFLVTASGDPWGNFNGLRPFYFNLASGSVTMAQGASIASGLTVSSGLSLTSGSVVVSSGSVSINTATANAKLTVSGLATYGSGYAQLEVVNQSDNSSRMLFGYDTNASIGWIQAVTTSVANRAIMINPNGGNVGIGVVPNSFVFQVSADSCGKPNGGSWSNSSDIRLKRNIKDLVGGLDIIRRLRPIECEYNGCGGLPEGMRTLSFIAQEVREVLPGAVSSHRGKLREDDAEETDILDFNMHEVLMHLVLAVKQLAAEVSSYKRQPLGRAS
jgi:hypothetical protein